MATSEFQHAFEHEFDPGLAERDDIFFPIVRRYALDRRVLAVARTRVEGAWAAYCGSVPGDNHDIESDAVLARGTKLDSRIARLMFPYPPFSDLPYAE